MRAASGVVALLSLSLQAAPPPEFYLEHDWYAIEILLFQYPNSAGSSDVLQEELYYEPPREMFPDVLVIALPADAKPAEVVGLNEHLFQGDLDGESWFYLPSKISALETVRSRIYQDQRLDESYHVTDDNSVFDLYPNWLQPDWFSPAKTWSDIFRKIGLPESDSSDLLQSTFDSQTEIQETPEVEELTIGQRIELEFGQFEAQLLSSLGSWEDSELALQTEADRLHRSSWDVIHHGKFHTPIEAGAKGHSFFMQFGSADADAYFPFEMLLNISKRLYFHANVSLWQHQPDSIGSLKTAVSTTTTYRQVFLLNEKRRVVDKDPHYFDHPLFGLLLKVAKLPIREDLLDLLEASDELIEPGD